MPKSKLYIVSREPARRQRVPNNPAIKSTPLIGRARELEEALSILSGLGPSNIILSEAKEHALNAMKGPELAKRKRIKSRTYDCLPWLDQEV